MTGANASWHTSTFYINSVSVLNPQQQAGDLIYWHSHQTFNRVKDRKTNNDILSSHVFQFRQLRVWKNPENVSCGTEIRAGTGSTKFPLIVEEQRERGTSEI